MRPLANFSLASLWPRLLVNDAWEHVDSARQASRLGLATEAARADVTLAKLARAEHRTEVPGDRAVRDTRTTESRL